MKKILSFLIIAISMFTLTACAGGNSGNNGNNGNNNGGNNPPPSTDPVYATEYTYNETHHWKKLISGVGEEKKDYAEHDNEQGKCECGKYFDCTHLLDFEKVTVDGIKGYRIVGYKDEDFFGNALYMHYEVPAYYQGPDDNKPLPVISIGYGAFANGVVNGITYNTVPIESVILKEGLLEIRDWAFKNAELTELIIPDTVVNTFKGGEIYNVCGGCYKLKRIDFGNGLKVLGSYNFGNSVTEVILGSSFTTIKPRAFYEIYNLEYLVIPKAVTFVPEGSVSSPNYQNVPLVMMFPAGVSKTKLCLELTKEEYQALLIPLRERDPVTGNILNPATYGFVIGWNGNCKVYFKDEWKYGANGKPEILVQK